MPLAKPKDERSRWGEVQFWLFGTAARPGAILWVGGALLFLAWGGIIALQMRSELARSGTDFYDSAAYSELFSLHGTFMVFLFAVPVFFGVGNLIVPKAVGARNLAFPRMNNLDLWLIILGGAALEIGYFIGQRPAGGWTGYTPLSRAEFQSGPGMDWWIWAVFLEAVGSTMAGVNFIVTILRLRRPGLKLSRMPVFAWSMLFTAFLVVVAGPFLLTNLLLLFLDRNFGTLFFDPSNPQATLLWQDLFWFYSHPATYIMLLPAFGIVSAVLGRFSGNRHFSYPLLVVGAAGVTVFSYLVWWHHMFTTGMWSGGRVMASFNTLAVSLFSGVVVVVWLAGLWRGRIRFTTPLLFALGVIAMFTIGGVDGVFLALVPLDVYFHDTYWLVAHFHYIIFGATGLGTFAAVYYWFPLALRRQLDERLGKWHFWGTLVGMNLTFFPMHLLGMLGMPRRVADYPPEWESINVLITLGAFVFAASQLVFAGNVVWTLLRGARVTDAVWGPPEEGPGALVTEAPASPTSPAAASAAAATPGGSGPGGAQ